MTEQAGFIFIYYGTFAGVGAVVGIIVAAAIQFFGNH